MALRINVLGGIGLGGAMLWTALCAPSRGTNRAHVAFVAAILALALKLEPSWQYFLSSAMAATMTTMSRMVPTW